jgi:hypothetical protein
MYRRSLVPEPFSLPRIPWTLIEGKIFAWRVKIFPSIRVRGMRGKEEGFRH